MTNIYDLVEQIERLSRASDTDDTSGYTGHQNSAGPDMDNVGWYCDGGNIGHSVFAIHTDDIPTLMERLTALPDRAFENGPALRDRPEFSGLRVEFHV